MNPKIAERFITQAFNLWIQPYLVKIGYSGPIEKTQVIFSIDGHVEVRINNAVRVEIITNKRKITDMALSFLSDESIEQLNRIKEEKDFGHFTMVKIRDIWVLAFDFRYSIKSSKDLLALGADYLEISENLLNKDKLLPSASNLYIAIANIGKAKMFLYPDKEIRLTKKHRILASRINIYSKNNMIDKDFVESFNYVREIFDRSRFDPSLTVNRQKIAKAIKDGKNMISDIKKLFSNTLSIPESTS